MTTDDTRIEPPQTPIPELAGSGDAESPPLALDSFTIDSLTLFEPPPPSVAAPAPSTTDDINALLTTSIEKPEPDPMLGSADSVRLNLGVRLTPSPDAAGRRAAGRSTATADEFGSDRAKPPYSWTTTLLASYASAVTMALAWVLLTHRGFRNADVAVPPPPAIDWGRTSAEKPSARASRGADLRVAKLGTALIVGDLEVVPLQVGFRSVNLVRIVDPKRAGRRSVSDCLVLTLRLTNRSTDHRLTPLELGTVRDADDRFEGSFIESANGERIGMFDLAMESEWSIEQQSFPSVKPGESEDVILVSEPIHDRKLASPLLWRVKIQTDAGKAEEIGVQFDRQEIVEASR